MMATKSKPKFLRRTWNKYSKLGKRRKKKQVWRRPTGRDNKMREKRKGKPAVVSVGYIQDKSERGKYNGKEIIEIRNLNEMKNITSKEKIVKLGNIGKKKKIEIAGYANKNNIEILNLNVKKFLREIENLKKRKKESKKVEEKKETKKKTKSKDKENKESKK